MSQTMSQTASNAMQVAKTGAAVAAAGAAAGTAYEVWVLMFSPLLPSPDGRDGAACVRWPAVVS